MAVKTTISEKDFPAIIVDYDLGEYCSFKTFANGAGQTTVLLKTSEGEFVLRYYENRSEKHAAFEVELFNFLQENNYPVPAVIKDCAGNFFNTYKGKPFIIIEFIRGEHCTDPNESFKEEGTAEVVKAAAQLHNLTEDRKLDFFKNREVFDTDYCLREYYKQSRTKDAEERETWLKNELSDLELPGTMPRCVCHADLNYENFIFQNGKVAAVLDFDMSFYYYPVYDVASLIYWWAMPPKKDFREKAAWFIVSEYTKHRKLSDEERLHIFDALKLIILLGISWSAEGDFEGEKKKIEFLDSIGRKNFTSMFG